MATLRLLAFALLLVWPVNTFAGPLSGSPPNAFMQLHVGFLTGGEDGSNYTLQEFYDYAFSGNRSATKTWEPVDDQWMLEVKFFDKPTQKDHRWAFVFQKRGVVALATRIVMDEKEVPAAFAPNIMIPILEKIQKEIGAGTPTAAAATRQKESAELEARQKARDDANRAAQKKKQDEEDQRIATEMAAGKEMARKEIEAKKLKEQQIRDVVVKGIEGVYVNEAGTKGGVIVVKPFSEEKIRVSYRKAQECAFDKKEIDLKYDAYSSSSQGILTEGKCELRFRFSIVREMELLSLSESQDCYLFCKSKASHMLGNYWKKKPSGK